MTLSMDQPPGAIFSPKLPTSGLIVGPHTRFTRRGLVLNDRTVPECYWVDDATGFETPDIIATATQNVQEDNELPDPAFYGGRTMTLTGWIQAGSYPVLVNMARALLDCIVGLQEEPLQVSTTAGGMFTQPTVAISCRLVDKPSVSLKVQQDWVGGILRAPFSFSLRASTDATFKSLVTHSQVIIPEFVSGLGRVYPRTYPLTYDALIDESGYPVTGVSANTVTVTNAGNWRAYPVLTFSGMLAGTRLVNVANGHEIILTSDVAHGDFLRIAIATGLVTDSTGASAAAKLDTASDWLALESGLNALNLVVSDFDLTGQVTIEWQDTTV